MSAQSRKLLPDRVAAEKFKVRMEWYVLICMPVQGAVEESSVRARNVEHTLVDCSMSQTDSDGRDEIWAINIKRLGRLGDLHQPSQHCFNPSDDISLRQAACTNKYFRRAERGCNLSSKAFKGENYHHRDGVASTHSLITFHLVPINPDWKHPGGSPESLQDWVRCMATLQSGIRVTSIFGCALQVAEGFRCEDVIFPFQRLHPDRGCSLVKVSRVTVSRVL
jgi:hypothetical protein